MNRLKITAAALTSWLAMGLYSAPTFAAMINATGADFQYGLNQAGITNANGRHNNANATDGLTGTFRSLGSNGAAVFSFDSAFSGTVTIWETTFNTCNNNGLGHAPTGRKLLMFMLEMPGMAISQAWHQIFPAGLYLGRLVMLRLLALRVEA